MAYSEWWKEAWPSLTCLLVAAAVAFGIGMTLRWWKARIQKRYQERIERQRQETSEQR